VWIDTGDAKGKLVEVGLADDNTACGTHRPDDRGVIPTSLDWQDYRTCSSHRAADSDNVFDSDDRAVTGLISQRDKCVEMLMSPDRISS
jgi:hypothetical protein